MYVKLNLWNLNIFGGLVVHQFYNERKQVKNQKFIPFFEITRICFVAHTSVLFYEFETIRKC